MQTLIDENKAVWQNHIKNQFTNDYQYDDEICNCMLELLPKMLDIKHENRCNLADVNNSLQVMINHQTKAA